ncbi:zinc dependent phospholipase C family protein [uncultured Oscillibacter sp.]|uniref:zinc dependent phospholipase C family protein n=1 Tax=uncultured Oscillibacter sp. TaxID=876091 RepID=UPI0025D7F703|nr:zinc dependent phospholipase C family protein [uncultured Oscillibacter sp.]
MQKRSHKLLASMLLECEHGFRAKRYELAFLFGSFQPDCNPLTYLKGSRRAQTLRGHNFTNSQLYINAHIKSLQTRSRWNIWQYYTLGKLTHYLADAFTYPHNEDYPESLIAHRQYEDELRQYLAEYLESQTLRRAKARQDLVDAIDELHDQYMETVADMRRDVQYILRATALLMAGCLPAAS